MGERLVDSRLNPNSIGIPIEIAEIGVMNWGAPAPILVANELRASIAFYLDSTADDWDGTTIHFRDPKKDRGKLAIVQLTGVCEFTRTPTSHDHTPNLLPEVSHSVWEITESAKLQKLFSKDSVGDYRHLVFGFHDSVFECVCSDFAIRHTVSTTYDVVQQLQAFVFGEDVDV